MEIKSLPFVELIKPFSEIGVNITHLSDAVNELCFKWTSCNYSELKFANEHYISTSLGVNPILGNYINVNAGQNLLAIANNFKTMTQTHGFSSWFVTTTAIMMRFECD